MAVCPPALGVTTALTGWLSPSVVPSPPGDSDASLAVAMSSGDGNSLPRAGRCAGRFRGAPPCVRRSSLWVSQAGWWHWDSGHGGDRASGPQQLEEKRFWGGMEHPPHPAPSTDPCPSRGQLLLRAAGLPPTLSLLSPQCWPCIPSWLRPQPRGSRPLGCPPSLLTPSPLSLHPFPPRWAAAPREGSPFPPRSVSQSFFHDQTTQ